MEPTARTENEHVLAGTTRRRFLAVSVGFALVYAVCVSFFYSSWMVERADVNVTLFDNVLNPSVLITSLVFSAWAGSRRSIRRIPCLVVGFGAFAFAIGGMFVAASQEGLALAFAASAAAGVGMGLVMPLYFEALAPYSSRGIAIGCGVMSLGGMAVNMVLGLLPRPVECALYVACLVGAAVCLAFATKGAPLDERAPNPRSPQTKHDFLDVFLVSGVCTFALSIVYGIVDMAAMGGSSSPATSVVISQFGGIVAAVAFLAYFGTRSRPSPSLLFNVVFGILSTGILFLPFLSNGYTVSLNILASAGWKLVMLALFYLVVVTYARERKKLLVGISLAYTLPRFGLFIGQNVAQFLGVGSSADFVRTTAVAFFLLYLILMVIWMVNSHERKKAETQARAADELLGRFAHEQENVRKLRCDVLADAHGLTNREKDILYLLAQGRDLAYICETLFLSKNTVKSYQKTIYAKLDVHSKQEIIGLVQADGPASAE